MKVLMLQNGKTRDVSAGYGNRLVGQGKAVPVKAEEKKEAPAEKPEKKTGKKADKNAEGQDRR